MCCFLALRTIGDEAPPRWWQRMNAVCFGSFQRGNSQYGCVTREHLSAERKERTGLKLGSLRSHAIQAIWWCHFLLDIASLLQEWVQIQRVVSRCKAIITFCISSPGRAKPHLLLLEHSPVLYLSIFIIYCLLSSHDSVTGEKNVKENINIHDELLVRISRSYMMGNHETLY